MKVARHEMPGTCPKGDPSQRDGVIVIPGYRSLSDPRTPLRPNHTVPLGRGISYTQPRHFMPGYLRSVPSSFVVLNYGGQAGTKIFLIPVHRIEALE